MAQQPCADRMEGARPLQLGARQARIRDEYGGIETLPCDCLVLAQPGEPEDALASALQALGIETHRVGDVQRARTIGDAMHEAAAVAYAL